MDKSLNNNASSDLDDISPTFSEPFKELLKQSSDIQENIKKITDFCNHANKAEKVNEDERAEDQDFWARINRGLKAQGFGQVETTESHSEGRLPLLESLVEVFVDVFNEYSKLANDFSELQEDYCIVKLELERRAKTESRGEADIKISVYGKDTTGRISVGKRVDRVFKAFMQHEVNPMREADAKIVAIIQSYEETIKKMSSDMRAQKSCFESSYKKLEMSLDDSQSKKNSQSYNQRTQQSDSELLEKLQIVDLVLKRLNLKDYHEIPKALSLIDKIIKSLPGIDGFIKQICNEISISLDSTLETIFDALKVKLNALKSLEKLRNQYKWDISDKNEHEIARKLQALSFFCTFFEVDENDELVHAIESIGVFVIEMKKFLGVI